MANHFNQNDNYMFDEQKKYGTLDQWVQAHQITDFTSWTYNGKSEHDLVDFIAEHYGESENNRLMMQFDPFI